MTNGGGSWLALGVLSSLLWASCGGQSIRYEDDDDGTQAGGSGFGASPGGGVAGTTPAGGVSGTGSPNGGTGNLPSGGVGAAPTGGRMGFGFGGFSGGVAGFGGVFAGAAGVGAAPFGGVAGFTTGGFGGRGRGMGGRFGAGGTGGRFGAGGRFGGRAMGGLGGAGGLGPNPLDGFIFDSPCGVVSGATCLLTMGCSNLEPALPGVHPTDVFVLMPGTPGVFYDVRIHVQGVVESKTYTGGVDQDGYSPVVPADGMYWGGAPVSTPATIYLLRVTSPAQDHFLNSISPPSMSSVAPPTIIDYRSTIRVEGGTAVRLVSADSDCTILRNCGLPMSSMACNPVSVPNLAPLLAANIDQPYSGQFVGIVVESVTVAP